MQDDDRRLTEAAMWRVRLTETGSTPEFEAWLREPENQASWDLLARPWNFFDEAADAPGVDGSVIDTRVGKTFG